MPHISKLNAPFFTAEQAKDRNIPRHALAYLPEF